jgi:hypothetical protein
MKENTYRSTSEIETLDPDRREKPLTRYSVIFGHIRFLSSSQGELSTSLSSPNYFTKASPYKAVSSY